MTTSYRRSMGRLALLPGLLLCATLVAAYDNTRRVIICVNGLGYKGQLEGITVHIPSGCVGPRPALSVYYRNDTGLNDTIVSAFEQAGPAAVGIPGPNEASAWLAVRDRFTVAISPPESQALFDNKNSFTKFMQSVPELARHVPATYASLDDAAYPFVFKACELGGRALFAASADSKDPRLSHSGAPAGLAL